MIITVLMLFSFFFLCLLVGAYMGTLRARSTFDLRVGRENSIAQISAYDIGNDQMPHDYDGPELVIDSIQHCNETQFFRDPKWAHYSTDANVHGRLVWNQKTGIIHSTSTIPCC